MKATNSRLDSSGNARDSGNQVGESLLDFKRKEIRSNRKRQREIEQEGENIDKFGCLYYNFRFISSLRMEINFSL